MYFYCCCFCPLWPYCYYHSSGIIRVTDPYYYDLPGDIAHELQPDLFDIIPENIFDELNPEGLVGVPGIPGESAFPALTPKPGAPGTRR